MIIHVPRYLDVDGGEFSTRISGEFVLQARKRGRVVRERKFKNLITNLGMNRWGGHSGTPPYRYCHVGVGTATPNVTDTQLATFVASSASGGSDTTSSLSESPYYSQRIITYIFAEGAYDGNLTEIGVAAGTSSDSGLFSRALILDSEGNPTSFPIASDEQLVAYYIIRVYPPLSDATGTVTISGADYGYTARAIRVTDPFYWAAPAGSSGSIASAVAANGPRLYTGSLNAITSSTPQGSALSGTPTASLSSYSSDSFYRDNAITYAPGAATGSPRTHMVIMVCGSFQVEYDPVFDKLVSRRLVLNNRYSWARA